MAARVGSVRVSAVPVPGLRALVALVSAVVLGDTIFYSAVTPLLPTYADDLDLGKTGAGVLEASYAAGTLAAAIPAGLLAARVGVRRTVLVGLGLLGLSSLAFGIAGSIVLLDLARFAQGVGGACSWAGALAWLVRRAPQERRGELIGAAMGAAIVGALLGPAVGAAAHAVGTRPVFGAAAILAAALAAWTLRVPAPPPGPVPPARTLVYAARDARVAGGMALVSLPGLLFAGVGVLGPLRLDDVGASAAGIGAVFLIGSGFEAATSPVVGRLSDRLGRLAPIRAGLLLAAPLLVLVPHPSVAWGVGALIVLASPAIGASWAPAMALMSDGAEARGVDPALGFALVNAAWGVGHVVGGAGAGALGDAFGDPVAFAVLGGVSLAVAALLARPRVDGALRAKEAST
jgi:MFS family permease